MVRVFFYAREPPPTARQPARACALADVMIPCLRQGIITGGSNHKI